MNRRLKTVIISAALAALVSTPAVLTNGAQTEQAPTRTGEKATKPVPMSCPVHPEIKARAAGKCPKCRMQERKQRAAREKKSRAAQSQEGNSANE
jgi:Heavy metal binding domain